VAVCGTFARRRAKHSSTSLSDPRLRKLNIKIYYESDVRRKSCIRKVIRIGLTLSVPFGRRESSEATAEAKMKFRLRRTLQYVRCYIDTADSCKFGIRETIG
jgi:DNA-binding transcriptional MerR regulator